MTSFTRRSAIIAAGASLAAPALAQQKPKQKLKGPGVYDPNAPPAPVAPGDPKTPGVYVVEPNAFPNSVVAVATGVPAFIGHTEKTKQRGPVKISSFLEYVAYFGGDDRPKFRVVSNQAVPDRDASLFYRAMRLFFANGGGDCYISSAGSYSDAPSLKSHIAALDALRREAEPSLLVAPEACRLNHGDCADFQSAMLAQCAELRSRFAILDVWPGDPGQISATAADIVQQRASLPANDRTWGAAYAPFLRTSGLVDPVTFQDFTDRKALAEILLKASAGDDKLELLARQLAKADAAFLADPAKCTALETALRSSFPIYAALMKAATDQLGVLPPSPAAAGACALTDNAYGVWKAPANISLINVIDPVARVTAAQQSDLNQPINGDAAVNVIRTFPGQGPMIWGARTLDGMDNDYRYISSRRTSIMIEQSANYAMQTYVYQPNTAQTWTNVRAMLSNFMISLWKQGALMGAKPDEAFFIKVGLGDTMTQQDILDGRMRVVVGYAMLRPAEFILLRLDQMMTS